MMRLTVYGFDISLFVRNISLLALPDPYMIATQVNANCSKAVNKKLTKQTKYDFVNTPLKFSIANLSIRKWEY